MKRTRVSLPLLIATLVVILFGTSCAKEEVIAPSSAAHGAAKSIKNEDPTLTGTNGGEVTPRGDEGEGTNTGISDDGDDQGDRERGRTKRAR